MVPVLFPKVDLAYKRGESWQWKCADGANLVAVLLEWSPSPAPAVTNSRFLITDTPVAEIVETGHGDRATFAATKEIYIYWFRRYVDCVLYGVLILCFSFIYASFFYFMLIA